MTFKLMANDLQTYPINLKTVEDVIDAKEPWFVADSHYRKGDHRYYGVCPYCSNPIQLVALYKKSEKLNRPPGGSAALPGTASRCLPDGRHVPKPVEDIGIYDEAAKLDCPYFKNNRPLRKNRRRAFSPLANAIQDIAVQHFDRCIDIISDDIGFRPSFSLCRRMLHVFFSAQGYLYSGAHLRNVPWMIAYFAKGENLYGQVIPANTGLARALIEKVPDAVFNERGQLKTRGKYFRINFNCTRHRCIIRNDGSLRETIDLRVKNYTDTMIPLDAPTVFTKRIVMDQDHFERLSFRSVCMGC